LLLGVRHESEPPVSTADHEDEALPPIVVLIVEERARAAAQLAQLLRVWGVAAAYPMTCLDEVAAYLERHSAPALVLLDHSLHNHTCLEIALWLAARPALRRRLRIAAYTNADEGEVRQRLRAHVVRLTRDPLLAERLLGHVGTAERTASEHRIGAAMASEPAFEAWYGSLYDAHLSKRLSISAVRLALLGLACTLPTDH